MNLIGATARYPITGCRRAEQSKIEKPCAPIPVSWCSSCPIGKSIQRSLPQNSSQGGSMNEQKLKTWLNHPFSLFLDEVGFTLEDKFLLCEWFSQSMHGL